AGREHGHLRAEAMDRAVFHIERDDAAAAAFAVHQQIDREKLDEELGPMLECCAIERVQHGVTGAIRGSAGTLRGSLAEMRGHAAERPLIDFSFLGAREWQAPVLE